MEGDHQEEEFLPDCLDEVEEDNNEEEINDEEIGEEEPEDDDDNDGEDEAEDEEEAEEEEDGDVEKEDDSQNKANENLSTYESISEIATDKMLAIAPIPGGGGGLVAFHDGGNSEACTSADISSVSYNTVPEEPLPSEPQMDVDMEAMMGAYSLGECGEGQNDSDDSNEDDDINEDEPPEAIYTRSPSRAPTTTQQYRGMKRRRTGRAQSPPKRSKSATCKSSSRKGKAKQKGSKALKVVSQRDLIRPESTTIPADPNEPRRPATAFKLFSNDFRREFANKYCHLDHFKMTEIASEVWRDMPLERKQEYQSEASRLQEDFLNKMKDYQSKKQHEKSNKPKNAYQIFMSDYLNKEYEKRKNLKTQSRLTKQDLFRRGVRKWKRLTKNEKKPYEEQSLISKNSLCNIKPCQSGESSSHKNRQLVQLSSSKASVSNLKNSSSKAGASSQQPATSSPRRNRRIEFSERDEVAQFQPDQTMATWYQASKGCR